MSSRSKIRHISVEIDQLFRVPVFLSIETFVTWFSSQRQYRCKLHLVPREGHTAACWPFSRRNKILRSSSLIWKLWLFDGSLLLFCIRRKGSVVGPSVTERGADVGCASYRIRSWHEFRCLKSQTWFIAGHTADSIPVFPDGQSQTEDGQTARALVIRHSSPKHEVQLSATNVSLWSTVPKLLFKILHKIMPDFRFYELYRPNSKAKLTQPLQRRVSIKAKNRNGMRVNARLHVISPDLCHHLSVRTETQQQLKIALNRNTAMLIAVCCWRDVTLYRLIKIWSVPRLAATAPIPWSFPPFHIIALPLPSPSPFLPFNRVRGITPMINFKTADVRRWDLAHSGDRSLFSDHHDY